MAVSEERGRGFEELLLKLESNDSQNNDNRTRQRYLKLNHFPVRATNNVNLNQEVYPGFSQLYSIRSVATHPSLFTNFQRITTQLSGRKVQQTKI